MAAAHTITYESIDVLNVLKLEDGNSWLKKEVRGRLLLVGDRYQYFGEPAIKCVIGSGVSAITVIAQKHDMVYALANLTASQSQKVGLSIAHFQKKQGALYCSKFSVIEVLVDGVPEYTSPEQVDMAIMYAPIMSYADIMCAKQNSLVSLKGTLCKFYTKTQNGPSKLELKNDNGQVVKVAIWGEQYNEVLDDAKTGQEMIFYDVLANHEREREYLGSAITAVKSSSSTKILLGELTTEIPAISIAELNTITGSHLMDAKVEGTIVAITPIFQLKGKQYAKVVIADNDSAVLVFIRKSDLLPMLCEDILNKAKLVISRFQMENGYINTDECTCIEYDTENVAVVQGDFKELLHAKVIEDYTYISQQQEGTVVSVKGTVVQVYNDERKATVVLQDSSGKSMYAYLWDDKKGAASTLSGGSNVVIYDIRIKTNGEKAVGTSYILSSSSATLIKDVTCEGDITELSGTLSGFNSDYIYIRNNERKHCLKASPEVKKQMHQFIASPVKITTQGNLAVTITKRQLNMN